jgi:hypothetical protein
VSALKNWVANIDKCVFFFAKFSQTFAEPDMNTLRIFYSIKLVGVMCFIYIVSIFVLP